MICGESESPNFRRAVYKGNRNAIPSLVRNEASKQLSASPLATPGWLIGPTSQLSRSSGYGPGNGLFPCRKGHGTAHAASLKTTAHEITAGVNRMQHWRRVFLAGPFSVISMHGPNYVVKRRYDDGGQSSSRQTRSRVPRMHRNSYKTKTSSHHHLPLCFYIPCVSSQQS